MKLRKTYLRKEVSFICICTLAMFIHLSSAQAQASLLNACSRNYSPILATLTPPTDHNNCGFTTKFKFATTGLSVTLSNHSPKSYVDNAILWNFGDGHTAKGKEVKHTYQKPGEYWCKMTISHHKECIEVRDFPVYVFDQQKKSKVVKHCINAKTYPNPTQDELFIAYELKKNSHILLTLTSLDQTTQRFILRDGYLSKGVYKEHQQVSHLPKGTYNINLWIDKKQVFRQKIMLY